MNPSTVLTPHGAGNASASPSTPAQRIGLPNLRLIRHAAVLIHRAVLLLGTAALAALAILFCNPDLADRWIALSPFAAESPVEQESDQEAVALAVTPVLPAAAPVPMATLHATTAATAQLARIAYIDRKPALEREEQLVSRWLSRRYRVAHDATKMMVASAYQTAHELKMDPLLILSVMAIESRFNPFAESPVGAQGLMQVMSKVHQDKFQALGGMQAALNPAANIRVGSLILKDYLKRGGSVEAALKLYVGAAALDTDFGYGEKVLAEYRRLKDVAVGKSVPVTTPVAKAPAAPKQSEPGPAKNENAEEVPLEPGQPLNVQKHGTADVPELLAG